MALQIGAVWKRLGIRLDISQDVLEGIAANAEDKPFQMLLHWKKTTASATPYHDLYDALCHSRVGLNNLAKEFCCKEFKLMIHFLTVQLFDPGQSVICELGRPLASHAEVLRLVTHSFPQTSDHRTGHIRSLAISLCF